MLRSLYSASFIVRSEIKLFVSLLYSLLLKKPLSLLNSTITFCFHNDHAFRLRLSSLPTNVKLINFVLEVLIHVKRFIVLDLRSNKHLKMGYGPFFFFVNQCDHVVSAYSLHRVSSIIRSS